jgi:hypothetical protein
VELVRRYSNHSDLQERLERAALRVARRADQSREAEDESVSGREPSVWRVQDRLNEEDVEEIIERFRAGTAKWVLADQFGISLSSVKLLLRQRGVGRYNGS